MTLPPARAIAERSGIDRATFDREIRPAARPVILRGLARDWPAVEAGRTSAEALVGYLKRFSHAEPVAAIVGAPEIDGRFFYTADLKALNFSRGQTPLGPFLDRLLRDRDAERPYAMAIQSIPVPDLLPGFVAENPATLVDAAVVPRLWLGNAIRVATHYDLMENVGVVVAGRRRFTVFPLDQIANLYMGPYELTPAGTPVSLVDVAAPDLARHPRFAEAWAHAETGVLEPGDAIYIPFHWWHAVDSLEPVNVFLNYWWNPARKGLASPYEAMLLALASVATLPEDQRLAWRSVFDHLVFRLDGAPAAHLPADMQGVLGDMDTATLERVRAILLQALSARG